MLYGDYPSELSKELMKVLSLKCAERLYIFDEFNMGAVEPNLITRCLYVPHTDNDFLDRKAGETFIDLVNKTGALIILDIQSKNTAVGFIYLKYCETIFYTDYLIVGDWTANKVINEKFVDIAQYFIDKLEVWNWHEYDWVKRKIGR